MRLGTLRFDTTLNSGLNLVFHNHWYLPCMQEAGEEMGGNAEAVDGVDDAVAGAAPGRGELVETVYLIHAGKLPASWRERLGGHACMVMDVDVGGPADQAGLKAGDVLAAVEPDPGIRHVRSGETPECLPGAQLAALPPGTDAALTILRDGREQTIHLTRTETVDGMGFYTFGVPVLDESTLASLEP